MYDTNYQMPVMSRKDRALRNFFSQPKFLWLGLLGFVVTFLTWFNNAFTLNSFDYSFFQEMGMDITEITAMMPLMNMIMIVVMAIGSIPSVLISLSYLLMHLNAKRPDKNFNVPTTILNVIATIGFVLACIVSAIFLFVIVIALFVFSFADPSLNSDAGLSTALVIICGIAYAIPLAIMILITYVNMNYTSSLKKSTTTNGTSIKGVKGYSIFAIISLIVLGISAVNSIFSFAVSAFTGQSPLLNLFNLVVNAVSFFQILLMYQFVSGFGKIIQTEEQTRLFESAPYNQVPYSETPVTGEAYDNQRPFYNNPYTTPQEAVAEVVEANLCKNCGAPVNDDDYFCMKCGTRIERD